ncbi:MAG: hypothetical protein SF123_16970 [Chloroflexota bacterium]|nr:hypothetical protein [Chloroflexota bacterium]
MKESQVIIERTRRVNETHQHIDLAVEPWLASVKPGQSLLVRRENGWNPYLREQWFPVAAGKGQITVELPASQGYEPGQVLSVMGLIGQPYRFRRTLRNVLLIAYDTDPTPLLMMIGALLANRVSVTLVLLGATASYTTGHLQPEVEVITGDSDLSWSNRVTTIGWADQVFVAVPQADELGYFKRVFELFSIMRADIPQGYLFGVFRPLLPCGISACSACMLRLRSGSALVCAQGPAFDLTQVQLG